MRNIFFWPWKNKGETECGPRSSDHRQKAVSVLFNSFHHHFRNSPPCLPTKKMIAESYNLSIDS